MATLTKRLEEKSKQVVERFQKDHPIWTAIRQPLTPEAKRIMHRIFRLYTDDGTDWGSIATKALEFAQTDKERAAIKNMQDNFTKESIDNLLAYLCRPYFGDISAEVRAEKSCDALIQMRAVIERVLARKDALLFLIMFYGSNVILDIFWNNANEPFAKAFPGFQAVKNDDTLNLFRDAIDSHTIDEQTFEDYANTYMEFVNLDLKCYDYFYNLS